VAVEGQAQRMTPTVPVGEGLEVIGVLYPVKVLGGARQQRTGCRCLSLLLTRLLLVAEVARGQREQTKAVTVPIVSLAPSLLLVVAVVGLAPPL